MAAKTPTMKDVARLAGVSVQTVSCVVNGTGSISVHTRQRVMRAIDELNYRPDPIARSMRTRQTRLIGLLVLDITNPVHSVIAEAVEAAAHASGYKVILYNVSNSPERERESLEAVAEGLVDGLVIVNSVDREQTLRFLAEEQIQSVLIDCETDSTVPTVMVDNLRAGYVATEHLIRLGHRRIAHISGSAPMIISQQRLEGYRRALADYGLNYERVVYLLKASWDWDFASGYRAMRELLADDPRPTAVFASSDQMAIGAYRAIVEAGLRIPQDISVVGFDDIEAAAYATPPLTTIRQPFTDMAASAVATLLKLIDGQRIEAPSHVLPFELVVRGSTAEAPHEGHPGSGTVSG